MHCVARSERCGSYSRILSMRMLPNGSIPAVAACGARTPTSAAMICVACSALVSMSAGRRVGACGHNPGTSNSVAGSLYAHTEQTQYCIRVCPIVDSALAQHNARGIHRYPGAFRRNFRKCCLWGARVPRAALSLLSPTHVRATLGRFLGSTIATTCDLGFPYLVSHPIS